MVMSGRGRVRMTLLSLFGVLLPVTGLHAAVTATIDRDSVELNESFTLEVFVDADIDVEPDISALQQDFYVGQSSQLSNTTIINGQITRSRTWKYVLMGKNVGQLIIPPLVVGTEQSEPLTVIIRETSHAPPGEADVFITSEVDQSETFVQAQVLLRIKVYRAVSTRQPSLQDPRFGGAEILVERAGDERSYDAILNGRVYKVVERVFAIFPQESGEVTISPARFEARVLRDGRISGRKVFESEPQKITVLPIPAPPADYPDAAWLPAHDLELTEHWSREPDELLAGEPITRKVTISVLGQLETQIPAIEPPTAKGVNIYPDKPDLSRRIESGGIRGIRTDQYAMIGVDPGIIQLPMLEVPWWDIAAGEWRVAHLPERMISILPSGEPPEPQQAETMPVTTETGGPPRIVTIHSGFWRRVSAILAVTWLLTVATWWWSGRAPRTPRDPEPAPIYKQQARFLRAARKAALNGDAAVLRQALLNWGRLQWPDDAPRSIGVLAMRVSSPLADELRRLSRVCYGANAPAWEGAALATALRSFAVIDNTEAAQADEFLPPLMPSG